MKTLQTVPTGRGGTDVRVGPPVSESLCDVAGMTNELPVAPVTKPARRSSRRQREAQLDLVLPPPPATRHDRQVRTCSRTRARWWFDQMRQLIDEGRSVDVPGVF